MANNFHFYTENPDDTRMQEKNNLSGEIKTFVGFMIYT